MDLSLVPPTSKGAASRRGVIEPSWQTDAIETYRRSWEEENVALRADMAGRITALTGCHVEAALVVVDREARAAFLALDGVRFRLDRRGLVLLRPCAFCGTGEFASAPLTTKEDVGHALGVWQPLHQSCELDDPPEW